MLVRDPQAVHRFLIEARHMYHLNHPNILRIMEVLDPPAGPYYVMPYMPAGSLAGKLRPGQPADYVVTIRVARDVASALVYAHGKGIIHRDLKPGNVLLDTDGRGYLADFGLVRTLFNDSATDITQSQTMGTAPYMSPAVARGEAEDTRCDSGVLRGGSWGGKPWFCHSAHRYWPAPVHRDFFDGIRLCLDVP
jgi:serine/threonine protein kinase